MKYCRYADLLGSRKAISPKVEPSATNVSRWERGKMEPTPGAYIRLGNLAAGFSTTDISREGKPGDAVFKALAIVPMTGLAPSVVRKVPPFDPDELIRLIKQESEA